MKKKILILLSYIILFLNTNLLGDENKKFLKIGLLAPLTGEYSELGNSLLYSLQLALDEINDSKVKGINESVPIGMKKSFETFAGVQGTPVYEAFKAGNLHYRRYLMVKPE